MKITGTFMILAASMASAVSGLAHHANVDGNGAIYMRLTKSGKTHVCMNTAWQFARKQTEHIVPKFDANKGTYSWAVATKSDRSLVEVGSWEGRKDHFCYAPAQGSGKHDYEALLHLLESTGNQGVGVYATDLKGQGHFYKWGKFFPGKWN